MAAVYYVEQTTNDGWPEIVGTRAEFDGAIELAADLIVRRDQNDALAIHLGDEDGPHVTVARMEHVTVAENERAFELDAHAVLTIDEPDEVPKTFVDAVKAERDLLRIDEYGGVTVLGERARIHPRDILVLVQINPLALEDDTQKRFRLMELDRAKSRPRDEGDADDDTAKRFKMMELNPGVNRRRRKNPDPEIYQEDVDAAVDKYKEFHRYEPRKLQEISVTIPRRVKKLGAARHTLYRSGKVDPATLKKPKRAVDYIHIHDAGVVAYETSGTPDTDVPEAFYSVTAVVQLGKCLGFALRDGSEVEGTNPLPDLCCTPDGKCLLVIQDKKKVLALLWGGALGVFARGIDG